MLRSACFVAALVVAAGAPGGGLAAERLSVVATFSIIGDLVANVGGEHVAVKTLVGPDSDTHVFAPSPTNAGFVAKADLVVVNGLGFEGWLDRLIAASGYSGPVVAASKGATLLPADPEAVEEDRAGQDREGRHDPHAWQSAANTVTYVENIADGLCRVDADHCAEYRTNAALYAAELGRLDADIKAGFARIPAERRKVITSHDAFGYFGDAYGVRFIAPQGVNTESEASAADVAALIQQIRAEGVTALFVENISDPRLIEQIGRETGVTPGGALYSDALSGPDGPAPSYLAMMRYNAALLQAAMQGS